jgi:Uma2 family endonuclease
MTISRRDTSYHTYSDYLAWSRTSGDELIDGAAYVREPPAPLLSHQILAEELHSQIRRAIKGTKWRVFLAPVDVRLPKSTEQDGRIDTVVQPDVLITCDLNKLDARGMRGAPDWLAEILSPSTARYDKNIKIPVYERAGVPEVWLIDFNARTVAIYRLSDGKYGPPTVVKLRGKTTLTSVPGITVRWAPIIASVLAIPGS